jgi:hypothetical protein
MAATSVCGATAVIVRLNTAVNAVIADLTMKAGFS